MFSPDDEPRKTEPTTTTGESGERGVRGHIDHRGPDQWRIDIDLGSDAFGQRRRISHTVHGSRKQAEAERVRLLHELGCGEYVAPSTLAVGDYLTQWLAHAKVNVAPQTYRRYKQIVENDLVPDLGRIRLTDLSPLQVQGFLARSAGRKCKNRERDLSPRTLLHYFRLLRRALGQAVRWQLIPRETRMRSWMRLGLFPWSCMPWTRTACLPFLMRCGARGGISCGTPVIGSATNLDPVQKERRPEGPPSVSDEASVDPSPSSGSSRHNPRHLASSPHRSTTGRSSHSRWRLPESLSASSARY